MLSYKHYLALLAVGLCVSVASTAQDIIIKQDKTEIQSKVAEITETTIKYKKWDNLDGPLYNISKDEVFMILYSNGKRETFNQYTKPSQQTNQTAYNNNNKQTAIVQPKNTRVDTIVDYKNRKVKYEPTRLDFGLQSPTTIGFSYDYRVVKNIFNIGVAYDYSFPKDDDITSDHFVFVYGSLYAPVNRLLQNYKKQDKGIFVFAHAGWGATAIEVTDYSGKTSTYSSSGFIWRMGVDYYITKGFGITVSSYKFKTGYAGIVFNL